MSIITKETKVLLLVLASAIMFAWLIFGPEVLQYMGGPVLFFR
ncbi:MAG: hypothetical protein AB2L12_13205 [Smithellaceae bacterium]|jgi:hypothetical protein